MMIGKQVKALLILEGEGATSISKRLKVAPQCVSRVIHGRMTSRRIRQAIAKILKKPYAEVWGSSEKDAA